MKCLPVSEVFLLGTSTGDRRITLLLQRRMPELIRQREAVEMNGFHCNVDILQHQTGVRLRLIRGAVLVSLRPQNLYPAECGRYDTATEGETSVTCCCLSQWFSPAAVFLQVYQTDSRTVFQSGDMPVKHKPRSFLSQCTSNRQQTTGEDRHKSISVHGFMWFCRYSTMTSGKLVEQTMRPSPSIRTRRGIVVSM